jgi:hypothetical protein
MKDVLSAFGSEIFRPLVTLLLPGALSLSTWTIVAITKNATVGQLVQKSRSESIALLVVLTLFMGLVCEELGSHLEEIFDRIRTRRNGTHKANWHRYLRLAFRVEPVGQHYLRTILLRLKFELGCLFGLIPAMIGIWFTDISPWARSWWFVGGLFLAAFFLYEAWASHELLGEIRVDILKGISEIPGDVPTDEHTQGEDAQAQGA